MKSTLCIQKQELLDNPGMYLEIAAEDSRREACQHRRRS